MPRPELQEGHLHATSLREGGLAATSDGGAGADGSRRRGRGRRSGRARPDRRPAPADDGALPAFDGAEPAVAALAERLPVLTLRDEHRLARRLDTARRTRPGEARDRALAGVAAAVGEAEQRVAARRAAVPTITYPAQLPVSARREDI